MLPNFVYNNCGAQPMKLFGVNILTLLCKLDHFIILKHFCHYIETAQLNKRVSKFIPKFLQRNSLRSHSYKTFYWRDLCLQLPSLPSLIIAGKARGLLMERSSLRCYTLVGSQPCPKILYQGVSGKRSGLLQYSNNHCHEKFYIVNPRANPGSCTSKLFTVSI